MSNSLEHLTARMHLIQDRKEKELRELVSDPSVYHIATQLVDSFMQDLDHLLNYSHAVRHSGKTEDIQTVYDETRRQVIETFHKLTGRDYRPTVCRQMDFLRVLGLVADKSGKIEEE